LSVMQYLQFFGILSWIVCVILWIAIVIIKNWSHVCLGFVEFSIIQEGRETL
jgi:hypothetical protein